MVRVQPLVRPRTLILASESPLPPHSGVRLRILHVARQIAQTADVDLAVLGPTEAADEEPFELIAFCDELSRTVAAARAWRTPYAVERRRSASMKALASEPLWSVVQVESPSLLPAVAHAQVPVVLDAFDVESDLLGSVAAQLPRSAARTRMLWEAAKTRRFEKAAIARANAVCATSQHDAEIFERWGAREVVMVRNGVDTAAMPFHPRHPGADLLYIGHLGYEPNVAAATELVSEVLPRVQSDVPDATVRLVGRDGVNLISLTAPQVSIVGEISDLEPELRRARAVVLPLRAGSGTRLKVLEALAAGVPVVATPFAVQGIDVRDGVDVLLGTSSQELAAQAARVCSDDALAARLAANGRALVERTYDWSIVGAPLRALHERLAESS